LQVTSRNEAVARHGANPRIDTYQGTSPLMAAAGVNLGASRKPGPKGRTNCWKR